MLVEKSSEVALITGEDTVVFDISTRLGELRVELVVGGDFEAETEFG